MGGLLLQRMNDRFTWYHIPLDQWRKLGIAGEHGDLQYEWLEDCDRSGSYC